MPYYRPTLTEIDQRILADFSSRIRKSGNAAQSAPLFRRSILGVLAHASAGAHHMQYANIEWLASQRFVHLMEDEFLDAEGLQFGIPRKGADYARGKALATGQNGATIAAGTLYQHTTNGQQYTVQSGVTITDGVATIQVKAVKMGAASNLLAGEIIGPVNSLEGVMPDAVVQVDGIHSGTDVESDDYYRERIWTRKKQPPQGGAKHDYVAWALEVPGVTRAWCIPHWVGIGTVGVMFTRDNDPDILPNDEQCQTVWAHIEPKRPITANEIFVFPPTPHEVDVSAKLYPNDEATQNAVTAELAEFLYREGKTNDDTETVLYFSRLSEAISTAASEHHHKLIYPMNDTVIAKHEIPVLGRLNFEDWQ